MFGERTLAALIALLLLLAGVGPAVGATVLDTSGPGVADHDGGPDDQWSEKNTTKTADDAYVTDDGDVVLEYEYDNESEDATGHVATNVSEGLAYLNVTDTNVSTNGTGDVTIVAEPDRLAANGTFSATKPDALDSLTFEYASVRNHTVSESSMDLTTTIAPENASEKDPELDSVTTSGFVESTASTVTTNGSFTVQGEMDDQSDREHEYVITERESGYDISVTESYEPRDAQNWNTSEAANATLESQYCGDSGFVQCSVAVDDHEFDDGRLDITYTASYDGLKTTFESLLPLALAEADAVSSEEANRIADQLTNVTVDRIAVDVSVGDGTGAVTWNASLSGTDDLALTVADGLDIAAAMQEQAMDNESVSMDAFGTSPAEMAAQIRTQVEAQRAADVTGTLEWNAAFDVTSDAATFELTASSETANWGSYVDELRANNGTVPPNTTAALTIETVDDRIETEGSLSVQQDGLLTKDFDDLETAIEESDDEDAEKVSEWLTAINDTEFQRARADLTWDNDTLEFEAGLAANNVSALTAPLPKNLSALESTYTDVDEGRTFVRLGGVVDGNASAEDVRELALVNESTTVHLAGEWNRSFPSMDTRSVEEYLGLVDDGSASDEFPTMMVAGGAMAVTAAAGGLLLFNRIG